MERGLEGAWVPVAANVAGKDLIVHELRVKYLVLDGGGYSIVDRSNHIVDSGEYLVDDAASPQPPDFSWQIEAGIQAGMMRESDKDFRGAIEIYKRLEQIGGAHQQEFHDLIDKLRRDNYIYE